MFYRYTHFWLRIFSETFFLYELRNRVVRPDESKTSAWKPWFVPNEMKLENGLKFLIHQYCFTSWIKILVIKVFCSYSLKDKFRCTKISEQIFYYIHYTFWIWDYVKLCDIPDSPVIIIPQLLNCSLKRFNKKRNNNVYK